MTRSSFAQFRTKVVRDLAWSLSSPSMLPNAVVDTTRLVNTEATLKWLQVLDDDPRELLTFLGHPRRRAKRLGFYMSALVEFFISNSPSLNTRKLVYARQVKENNTVVGSLKFVFECAPDDAEVRCALGATGDTQESLLCHWECSIKFFVGDHGAFVGPYLTETLNDRLEAGAKKLRLSQLDAVKRWASREFQKENAPLHFCAIVKGYLFYPEETCPVQQNRVARDHLRGTWARDIDELAMLLDGKDKLWAILPKPYWLSPCVAELHLSSQTYVVPAVHEIGALDPLDSYTLEELRPKLEINSEELPATPVMLAVLESTVDDPLRAFETARGFLLPSHWDSKTIASRRLLSDTVTDHRLFVSSENARVDDDDDDHEEIVAAEDACDLIQRLLGSEKSSGQRQQLLKNPDRLRDRARALLKATSEERGIEIGPLAVACCRELRRVKRTDATPLGFALVEAASDDFVHSSRCIEADQFYSEACRGEYRYLEIATKCCELLATDTERLESREYAAEKLINAHEKVPLEAAAKLVVLRGRDSATLSTTDLCAAIRRLVRAGALRSAEQLAIKADTEDGSEDDLIQVRTAVVDECRASGHLNLATKLERKWFEARRLSLSREQQYTTMRMPPVWIRSDALETTGKSLLRLGPSVGVRFMSNFCEDDLTEILGMDVEWPHDDKMAPPSLLQLATTNHEVIVYDLPNMTERGRRALSAYLSSPKIVILGFSVKGDIARLQQYAEFQNDGLWMKECSLRIIDLQTEKSLSLSGLCKRKLGFGLCKTFQCADWRMRPVQEHLLHYAALDAFALLVVASTSNVAFVERSIPTDREESDTTQTKSLALVAVKERWMRLVVVLPLTAKLSLEKVANLQKGRRYRFAETGAELEARFGAPRGQVGPFGPRAPVIFHDTLLDKRLSCGSGHRDHSAVFVAGAAALSELNREGEAAFFADVAIS